MKTLAPTVDSHFPELEASDPFVILSTLLLLVQEALTITINEARERRAQTEEAQREWWARRVAGATITPEQISELLRQAEESED